MATLLQQASGLKASAHCGGHGAALPVNYMFLLRLCFEISRVCKRPLRAFRSSTPSFLFPILSFHHRWLNLPTHTVGFMKQVRCFGKIIWVMSMFVSNIAIHCLNLFSRLRSRFRSCHPYVTAGLCFCLDIQFETRGSFFTPSKTGLDEFRAGVRRLARQNASCEVDNKAGVPVSWLRPCYKWHSTNGANKGRRRFKPWRWREVVSMKRLKMQNIQNQRRCGNKGLDAAEGHKYTNSLVPCYQHPNVSTKNRFGFPSAKTFSRPSTRTNGFLYDFVRQKRFSLDLHIIGRSRGIGWTLVFFAPPSMN